MCGSAVSAQQRDTTRSDSTKRTPTARRLDAVVVTDSRVTGIDRRVPAQLDDIKLDNVAAGPGAAYEMLRRLPGLSLFDDQGSRHQPELDLRGFIVSPVVGQPQGVSVFLDGVRINEPDAQQVNFDLIPMDAVNRAELVRGPSAIFGKNSLAGSLLLFTSRGVGGAQTSVDVDGGPYGYRSALVKASGQVGGVGGVDGMMTARVSDEHGWRDATGARTQMLFGNVGRTRDSSDVALTVMYANNKLFEAGSLPESYLDVNRRINYTPGDFFQPEMLHLALRGRRTVGDGQLSGNLFARQNDYEQYNGNIPPPNSDGFVRNRSAGGLAEWTRLATIGGVSSTLTFGGEYNRANVGYRFLAVESPGVPADDDDLADLGCAVPSGLCTDVRTDEDNAALYAQASISFTPSVSLTVALRGDFVRTSIADRITPDHGGTNTYWRASPKVGLTYTPTDAMRAYVAISTGFRAPAALELSCADASAPCSLPFALGADPPLEPVKVLDYEAGVDFTPTAKTTVSIATFLSRVDDDILFVQPTATSGFFQNVPHTRRAGVDLSGSLDLRGGFRTSGSYSYVAATYRSTVQLASALDDEPATTPGNRFPTSPVQRAMAGVDFTRSIARGVLDAAVEVRGVSGQYLRGDEANTQAQLPGYSVTDVHVSGRFAHGTVRAYITNLFDRQYASFGVYAQNAKGPIGGPTPADPDDAPIERFLTPGQPRLFTLSVSIHR
ncbi:MAG TPA: TonB-dependent receptor [Gemmatimonadaceae bacterium]|nr:TonB-dependent receptor [Gemmatimonadaceae bacterium]